MFVGRTLAIATMHGKETVISPLVDEALGVTSRATGSLDTDRMGTFSGEVEREGDPVSVLRRKCIEGMELIGCDLGIANEGSFGPHPQFPFVPADEEFMVFMDRANGLEVIHRELSAETNYSGAETGSRKELKAFAEKALFPSHALILRASKHDFTGMLKGIHDPDLLESVFEGLLASHGTVYVETDMRAMHNPTRMRTIEKATRGLLEKILSICPVCESPGFTVTQTVAGLPCSLCHAPTRSLKTLVYGCQACGHKEARARPDGRKEEEPMYCDHCNP